MIKYSPLDIVSLLKKTSIVLVLVLTACVYRLDIQQGNILEQKDIDKLRAGFSKNQVLFVLGESVLQDGFADNKWVYLYSFKDSNENTLTTSKLTLVFDGDQLVTAFGDYEIPQSLQAK